MSIITTLLGNDKLKDSRSDINTNFSNLNSDKAEKSNVLELDNTTAFTPTSDYHPITKKYVDDLSSYDSAGCLANPSYTDNGSGSVTVNNVDVTLYNNSTFIGNPAKYTLTGITATLTDHTTNYIIGDYNSGSPIMRVTTDVSEINESNIIPIFTIVRTGSVLHTINWDSLALGMASKTHLSIVKTQRYRRESGLALSEYGTRNLNLTSGIVWIGCNPINLSEVLTATDKLVLCYHSAGVWVSDFTATSYNNTQYDNGTDLVTLTANRYAVNWVYRGVEDQKHIYITLGIGDYTLAQAQAAQPPQPPSIVSSHAMLVGKIIVQKSASTAYSIQSTFDVVLSGGSVTSHSDLTNLSWGSSGHTGTVKTIPFFDGSGLASSSSNFVYDTDKVGIGTDTPLTTLHIKSSSSSTPRQLLIENASSGAESSALYLWHNTASPAVNDFAGTILTRMNNSALTAVNASSFATQMTNVTAGSESSDLIISLLKAGTLTETFRLVGLTGYIGNGTSSPVSDINIVGTTFPDTAITIDRMSANGGSPHLIFRKARGTTSSPTAVISGDYLGEIFAEGYGATGFPALTSAGSGISFIASENWTDTAQGSRLAFSTTLNGGTTYSEKMTILGSGNVGIGITTPTFKLDVREEKTVSSYADAIMYIGNTGTAVGDTAMLRMGSNQGEVNRERAILVAGLDGATGGYLAFTTRKSGTGITEKMRILESGFVGIGTTTPSYMLDVSGTINIRQDSGILRWNGGDIEIQEISNGFAFKTYDTALTEKMRILGNGNVGIGITAPTAQLHVYNNVADSTTTFLVNKNNASATGNIADFQFNGASKARVAYDGVIYAPSIANTSTSSNSVVQLNSTGTTIYRNVADANSSLTVNQQNTSSTGNIVDFKFNNSGVAFINKSGYFYLPGIINPTTANNSRIYLTNNGTEISRNVADGNACLIINQAIAGASSTGDILKAQFNGSDRFRVLYDGTVEMNNEDWLRSKDYAGTSFVNMFKVNASNEIEVGGTLNIGTLSLTEDSGAMTLVNMPISSTPTAGTEMSYSFSIDSTVVAKVYGEANGTGGVQNQRFETSGLKLTLGSDATGDIYYRNSSGLFTRLGIGSANQVLTVSGGLPSWQTATTGFSDPMTSRGDIIYRNASNVTARLGKGTAGQVLTSDGTDIAWATPSSSGGYTTTTTSSATYNETATSGEKVIICNTTSNNITVNLPTAVGNTAKFHIKKIIAANSVTIDGSGSETIDGGTTAIITSQYASITIVSNNSNWYII